jgi:DNA-directed RNA polymerase subunit A'
MLSATSEVVAVEFRYLSPDEIVKNSVCQVTSGDRLNSARKKKLPVPMDPTEHVTLDDDRMGPTENGKECVTCGGDNKQCPGHPGHIVLNAKILHPLKTFQKMCAKLLSCFCHRCSVILLSEDCINILGIPPVGTGKGCVSPIERFTRVRTAILKVDSCPSCHIEVRKYSHVKEKIVASVSDTKCEMFADEIQAIFNDVKDGDLRLLGINPQAFHPKWLVLTVFPVIPPISRPSVMMDGQKLDDDLTNIYASILNTNNRIKSAQSQKDKDELVSMLSYHIRTLMDNSKGSSKHSNGRPKKGVKERLANKSGLFRSGLLGKRVM